MIYREISGDVFSADDSFALAHCISADCKMGSGIAVSFKERFPEMKSWLMQRGPKVGQAIIYDGGKPVINLITKSRFWLKPTYTTFRQAIADMKDKMLELDINKLAIPKIGAGIDRLDWDKNRNIITEEFADTDIEIVVYMLK